LSQELEKRIGGGWNEDLIARVAKQFEEKTVSLARACGENNPLGRNLDAARCVVVRYR
jgi:hypothetical protein